MSGEPDARVRHIAGPAEFAATFAASPQTMARLGRYAALLAQWQRAVNLVAPSTLGEMWHRHFADSAQLLPLIGGARTLVDLGSGAGFPGLVLAILLADACAAPERREQRTAAPGQNAQAVRRVTLVESNTRKCAFLAQVVREVRLPAWIAVDILSTRIETAATQATLRGADVVAARALAPLHGLLALAAPLFTSATVGVFLKGRDAAAELEVARQMWNFSAELLPSCTERAAHILVIRHPEPKVPDARGAEAAPMAKTRRTGKAIRDRRTMRE
jgi:16S rRNA (guanine527-N7)-methyltransferase